MAAFFGSRLTRSLNNDYVAAVPQKALNSPTCHGPCQRESFWISFDKVLEISEIPVYFHSFLRSKSGEMIDIGKCYGYCHPSRKELYPDLVRHATQMIQLS